MSWRKAQSVHRVRCCSCKRPRCFERQSCVDAEKVTSHWLLGWQGTNCASWMRSGPWCLMLRRNAGVSVAWWQSVSRAQLLSLSSASVLWLLFFPPRPHLHSPATFHSFFLLTCLVNRTRTVIIGADTTAASSELRTLLFVASDVGKPTGLAPTSPRPLRPLDISPPVTRFTTTAHSPYYLLIALLFFLLLRPSTSFFFLYFPPLLQASSTPFQPIQSHADSDLKKDQPLGSKGNYAFKMIRSWLFRSLCISAFASSALAAIADIDSVPRESSDQVVPGAYIVELSGGSLPSKRSVRLFSLLLRRGCGSLIRKWWLHLCAWFFLIALLQRARLSWMT